MRLFVSVVLLLFLAQSLQPPSPTPPKSAGTHQRERNPEQENTSANEQATNNLVTAINQLTSEIATWNQQQRSAPHEDKSSAEWWSIGNTVLVTIFTGILAVLAILQWRALHRQADIADAYKVITDKLREIANEQLTITKAAEARHDTEKMAEIMEGVKERGRSDERYSEQLELARTNTGIAKQSADAVVASERAWVTVTLEWSPGYPGMHPWTISDELSHTVTIRVKYKNDGRTPAWITDRRARLQIFEGMQMPEDPPSLADTDIIEHGIVSLAAGQEKWFDTPLRCEGRQTLDNIVAIYGVIHYRTVVKGTGESKFGYDVAFGGQTLRLLESNTWNDNS